MAEVTQVLVKYQLDKHGRKVNVGEGEGAVLEMWVPLDCTDTTIRGKRIHRSFYSSTRYNVIEIE